MGDNRRGGSVSVGYESSIDVDDVVFKERLLAREVEDLEAQLHAARRESTSLRQTVEQKNNTIALMQEVVDRLRKEQLDSNAQLVELEGKLKKYRQDESPAVVHDKELTASLQQYVSELERERDQLKRHVRYLEKLLVEQKQLFRRRQQERDGATTGTNSSDTPGTAGKLTNESIAGIHAEPESPTHAVSVVSGTPTAANRSAVAKNTVAVVMEQDTVDNIHPPRFHESPQQRLIPEREFATPTPQVRTPVAANDDSAIRELASAIKEIGSEVREALRVARTTPETSGGRHASSPAGTDTSANIVAAPSATKMEQSTEQENITNDRQMLNDMRSDIRRLEAALQRQSTAPRHQLSGSDDDAGVKGAEKSRVDQSDERNKGLPSGDNRRLGKAGSSAEEAVTVKRSFTRKAGTGNRAVGAARGVDAASYPDVNEGRSVSSVTVSSSEQSPTPTPAPILEKSSASTLRYHEDASAGNPSHRHGTTPGGAGEVVFETPTSRRLAAGSALEGVSRHLQLDEPANSNVSPRSRSGGNGRMHFHRQPQLASRSESATSSHRRDAELSPSHLTTHGSTDTIIPGSPGTSGVRLSRFSKPSHSTASISAIPQPTHGPRFPTNTAVAYSDPADDGDSGIPMRIKGYKKV